MRGGTRHRGACPPGLLVLRPRLAGRLDEGLAQGLVLVCAPAGYGKTVLLADWVASGQRPGCHWAPLITFSVPLRAGLPPLIGVRTVRLGCPACWTR